MENLASKKLAQETAAVLSQLVNGGSASVSNIVAIARYAQLAILEEENTGMKSWKLENLAAGLRAVVEIIERDAKAGGK